MNTAFSKLGLGLIFAAALIYFLMVVNFQSWTDPFIIITALPGAFAGILWMLFLTHTTFNVESMMGAIMSIGVATANSILMITFANEQLREGRNALDAAIVAGHTRLRPVVMTALAMIIGMVPMALGLGEGGEQNAPLGRAVIGGCLLATVATLFFVPVVFSVIRHKTRPREMATIQILSARNSNWRLSIKKKSQPKTSKEQNEHTETRRKSCHRYRCLKRNWRRHCQTSRRGRRERCR